MKAFEIFSRDLAGSEFSRAGSDRRAYYHTLRQALKDELTAGVDCAFLTHYGKLLEQASPVYLYLLDAAALWECHEAVIGAMRFPRDIGQGFPFLVNGSRLSWDRMQQLSDKGGLPVAVLDDELRARLTGLLAYGSARGRKIGRMDVPAVNGRATLAVADPVSAPVALPEKPAPSAQDGEELSRLREKVQQLEAEISRLNSQPKVDYDAAYTAEMILHNRMDEALTQSRRVGGKLQETLEELTRVQAEAAESQTRADQAQEQLQILRARKDAALQAAEAARSQCLQLESEAARSLTEKEAAEAALAQSRAKLTEANAALRRAQRLAADTAAAADMTRRQAESLR